MKRIQIEVPANALPDENDIEILRAGGVQRIHPGWYSVVYNGVNCDPSTVVRARRNRRGEISHGKHRREWVAAVRLEEGTFMFTFPSAAQRAAFLRESGAEEYATTVIRPTDVR